MNKKLVGLAMSLSLIVPSLVGAQNASLARPFKALQEIRDNKREELKDLREEANEEAKDLREKMKEQQEAAREEMKTVREEAREEAKQEMEATRELIKTGIILPAEAVKAFEVKREAIKAEFEAKREEAKQMFEVRREEAKQMMETKREEFKKKLEVVRDERKKQIAGKLFEDLNKLNAKATDNMVKAVDQIEGVLNRILNRSEKASANGENITGVIAAGEAAKIAIREARAAIQTQAAKVYSAPTTTSETTLKSDLGGVRDVLRSDLGVIKTKVKSARDAVQSAAVSLAQIPKVDELEVEENGDDDNTVSTSTPIFTPTSTATSSVQ